MAFIEPCFGIGHNLSLICQMTSEDIKHQLIIIRQTWLTRRHIQQQTDLFTCRHRHTWLTCSHSHRQTWLTCRHLHRHTWFTCRHLHRHTWFTCRHYTDRPGSHADTYTERPGSHADTYTDRPGSHADTTTDRPGQVERGSITFDQCCFDV